MSNFKIIVNNAFESCEIQDMLFELGYSWGNNRNVYQYLDKKYLYIYEYSENYKDISWDDKKRYFEKHLNKEITLSQLKDMLVLHRNNIDDKTHHFLLTPKINDKFYVTSDNKVYCWLNEKWEKSNMKISDLTPIHKTQPANQTLEVKEYLDADNGYSYHKCSTGMYDDKWVEIPEDAEVAVYHVRSNLVYFWKNSGKQHWNSNQWRNCKTHSFTSLDKFLLNHSTSKIVWQRNKPTPQTNSTDTNLISGIENTDDNHTSLISGANAFRALADGKKIEYFDNLNKEWDDDISILPLSILLKNTCKFRLKPRTIKIGDVEIIAPETKPPKEDTWFYIPNVFNIDSFDRFKWFNSSTDLRLLKNGLVHLTKENAIAHSLALIKISGGEV